MVKYKINSKKEIIKTDFEERFNKEDFTTHLAVAEKQLKELTAQQDVYKAKYENIERNHPQVTKVSESDKNAIWLYHENKVSYKHMEDKIKQLKKAIKGVKDEMKVIEKQTGLTF